VNETDMRLYNWKGKSTELSEGYVILKAGKKLEGMISLSGSPEKVEEISVHTLGKEFELPIASVSKYGLFKEELTVGGDPTLFEWKGTAIVMGKAVSKTKERQGYIIDQKGNRFEGALQLKKVEGDLDQATINGSYGKKKFGIHEVKEYGLLLTINELNKGGSKEYKREGKNFAESTIVYYDGREDKGWMAFKQCNYTDDGWAYSDILFTKTYEGLLKSIEDDQVERVFRKSSIGENLEYFKYEGYFLDAEELQNSNFKDPSKEFNPGVVTFQDGTEKSGLVAQERGRGNYFTRTILFKSGEDAIQQFGIDEVKSFSQEYLDPDDLEVEFHHFIIDQKVFIEELFDGKVFRLVQNPFPTHVNERATKVAKLGTGWGGQIVQTQMMKLTELDRFRASLTEDDFAERSERINKDLEQIRSMSVEELEVEKSAMLNGRTEEEYLNELDNGNSFNQVAEKYVWQAITSEIMRKQLIQGVEVYYKEWYFINKKENKKYIIWRQDYKNQSQELLMGCLDYLMLDKDQQKFYSSWEHRFETIKYLDQCYSE